MAGDHTKSASLQEDKHRTLRTHTEHKEPSISAGPRVLTSVLNPKHRASSRAVVSALIAKYIRSRARSGARAKPPQGVVMKTIKQMEHSPQSTRTDPTESISLAHTTAYTEGVSSSPHAFSTRYVTCTPSHLTRVNAQRLNATPNLFLMESAARSKSSEGSYLCPVYESSLSAVSSLNTRLTLNGSSTLLSSHATNSNTKHKDGAGLLSFLSRGPTAEERDASALQRESQPLLHATSVTSMSASHRESKDANKTDITVSSTLHDEKNEQGGGARQNERESHTHQHSTGVLQSTQPTASMSYPCATGATSTADRSHTSTSLASEATSCGSLSANSIPVPSELQPSSHANVTSSACEVSNDGIVRNSRKRKMSGTEELNTEDKHTELHKQNLKQVERSTDHEEKENAHKRARVDREIRSKTTVETMPTEPQSERDVIVISSDEEDREDIQS